MARIYLDHGATTPMHPLVIEKMAETMATVYGNPSSVHRLGQKAHGVMEDARQVVAESIGAKAHEIVFTSGGTESDNTAIIQTALANQHKGKHLITTAVEHPAVLNTMEYLQGEGYEVTYLGVDKLGNLSLAEFEAALRPDTILVSIMHTNNETGVQFPLTEIGDILANHPAYFHSDGVQAYGLATIAVQELGLDLFSATAHKINGPKGLGFLYRRDGLMMKPLIHGGEQEEKRRGGTENIPGIVGLATAVSLLTTAEKANRLASYESFNESIIKGLEAAKIDFSINGDVSRKSPHILNLRFKNVPNDLLLMQLDLQGIALSIGSACTAGNVEPSHVLESMYGLGHQATKESLRISFGLGNTSEEIANFLAHLIQTIEGLKS